MKMTDWTFEGKCRLLLLLQVQRKNASTSFASVPFAPFWNLPLSFSAPFLPVSEPFQPFFASSFLAFFSSLGFLQFVPLPCAFLLLGAASQVLSVSSHHSTNALSLLPFHTSRPFSSSVLTFATKFVAFQRRSQHLLLCTLLHRFNSLDQPDNSLLMKFQLSPDRPSLLHRRPAIAWQKIQGNQVPSPHQFAASIGKNIDFRSIRLSAFCRYDGNQVLRSRRDKFDLRCHGLQRNVHVIICD